MKVVLVFLALALVVVNASPRRTRRQTWSFPGEDDNNRPNNNNNNNNNININSRPRPPTTQRPQSTRPPGGSTTPTPAPGVIFTVPCECPATPQYNPVCGDDGNTYVNRQKLECARTCGSNVQFVRLGVCATPRR